MEQDAKQRLAERLDQSLLEHTHALSQKKEGPQLPDVYELQALTHLTVDSSSASLFKNRISNQPG